MAKSTMVVVPPCAAATVPVSKSSTRGGAAERHVQVRVRVDAAGDDVFAGGVDRSRRPVPRSMTGLGDGGDLAVPIDPDVRRGRCRSCVAWRCGDEPVPFLSADNQRALR
jgi:hypothetical protein